MEITELLLIGRPSSKGRGFLGAGPKYENLGVVELVIKRADGNLKLLETLAADVERKLEL